MIVLEVLTHLAPIVGGNHSAVAEGQPFGKAVEGFAFVGFPLNDGSQFWIADVLKQEASTNDPS